MRPSEQHDLLAYGCGLTNAADRPTRGSGDLRRADFAGAAARLEPPLPRAAAAVRSRFVGKEAWRGAFGARAALGLQPRRLGDTATLRAARPLRPPTRPCRMPSGSAGSPSCAGWRKATGLRPVARPGLVVCGAVLSACVAAWAAHGDHTAAIRAHLALYALAFAAYLCALRSARGLSARGLRAALVAAVAWRVALACAPPLLSDDVYRYGVGRPHPGPRRQPLRVAEPARVRPRWPHLRDEVWQRVNHKDYTAIYPPLWQLAARAVIAVHDSVAAMKLFLVGCELAALAAAGRAPAAPRAAARAPAGHGLEPAGAGRDRGQRPQRRRSRSLFLVAVAALARDAGGRWPPRWRPRWARRPRCCPGLVAASWARRYRLGHVARGGGSWRCARSGPIAGPGPGLWISLGKYGQFWRFNETLFAALAGARRRVTTLAVRLCLAAARGLALAACWPCAEPTPTTAGLAVVDRAGCC